MFYDNLKSICEKKDLKITPTVLECGGTKGIISGWKKGAMPNSDIVMKLSTKLNVSTDFLLFGKKTIDNISTTEKELLDFFRKLSPNEQQRIIGRCEEIVSSKEYTEPEIIEIAARSKKENVPKISTDEF